MAVGCGADIAGHHSMPALHSSIVPPDIFNGAGGLLIGSITTSAYGALETSSSNPTLWHLQTRILRAQGVYDCRCRKTGRPSSANSFGAGSYTYLLGGLRGH